MDICFAVNDDDDISLSLYTGRFEIGVGGMDAERCVEHAGRCS